MERERWKVRIVVIVALVTAVMVGIIYYLQFLRPVELSEGVLISIMDVVEKGSEQNVTE